MRTLIDNEWEYIVAYNSILRVKFLAVMTVETIIFYVFNVSDFNLLKFLHSFYPYTEW